MKIINETMKSAFTLSDENLDITPTATPKFQSKELVSKINSNKNSVLLISFGVPAETLWVRETKRILNGLKQHGSSIMFFKSLIHNFHVCWGTDMNSSLSFARHYSNNGQTFAALNF